METENERKNPDILNTNDKIHLYDIEFEDMDVARRLVEEDMRHYTKEEEGQN